MTGRQARPALVDSGLSNLARTASPTDGPEAAASADAPDTERVRTTIAICVATFRRPHLLLDLLESLTEALEGLPARLVLVDNDPAESGRAIVESFTATYAIDYITEPQPGIAAARNASLRAIRAEEEFIVFIDDDERVSPGWLRLLLSAADRTGADVVAGPVVSVLSDDIPAWIRAGGFHQRRRLRTDQNLQWPAVTNNTLVRANALRSAGWPTFDESFSHTGGSDSDFFWRLERAVTLNKVWCDEAEVFEDVPHDRASFRWIFRRAVRVGNVTGRLALRETSQFSVVCQGGARILGGAVGTAVDLLRGRGLNGRQVVNLIRGIGWIGAALNLHVVEYRRPET